MAHRLTVWRGRVRAMIIVSRIRTTAAGATWVQEHAGQSRVAPVDDSPVRLHRCDLTDRCFPCARHGRPGRPGREEVSNPMQHYAPNSLAVPRICLYRSYYVTANTFLSVTHRPIVYRLRSSLSYKSTKLARFFCTPCRKSHERIAFFCSYVNRA